jgi:ATP/maltotriose-dependent transcriptional regulator MalT
LASLEGTIAPPGVVADLQVRLAIALVFSGHSEEATGPIEEALTLAQHHELPDVLVRALMVKATHLAFGGRAKEARSLYELSRDVARLEGITRSEIDAEADLADLCMTRDLPGAEEHAKAALALARRWGQRDSEALVAVNLMYILTMLGRFEEAKRLGTEMLQLGGDERPGADRINCALACLQALRGNLDAAREHLDGCRALAESEDVQNRAVYAAAAAAVLLAEGDRWRALETARRAIEEALEGGFGVAHETVRLAFPVALEAAVEVGDYDEADRLAELLAARPQGEVPPFLRAQVTRAKALVALVRGDDERVEEDLVSAETAFRELTYPYWTARAQLDRAEWLARRERGDEAAALAGEAAATFERVGSVPMATRARTLFEPELAIES